MSDNNWDIDVDDPDYSEAPKAVRDAYKAARAELNKVQRSYEKVQTQLTEFNLRDVLTDKGYSPKLSKFVIQAGVDASSEEAVSAWLDDNKDLFGAPAPKSDPPQPQDPPAPTANEPPEDVRNAYEQMANTQQQGQTAFSDYEEKLKQVEAKLPENARPEQVAALFAQEGI